MGFKVSLILFAVSGATELLLCFFIRKPRMRFIPPAILLVLSLALYLYGRLAPLEGLKDLAYMVTGVFIFFGFLSSAAVALIFNLITRKSTGLIKNIYDYENFKNVPNQSIFHSLIL